VYVDMRGIGRKAIVRGLGKEYLKGKLSSGNSTRPKLNQIVADHAAQHGSSSNVPSTSSSNPPLPPRSSYKKQ
jgi:hypothetical protein